MNILIVEDENIISRALQDELKPEGFKISIAKNGKEALDIMRSKSNRPDIVLLDIIMPVINGFQILELIQKDREDNLRAIPVIVLSNLGQDEDIKRAMSLGAVDYYVKAQHPISEVVEKIKNFLQKGGALRNPLVSTTYVVSTNPSITTKNPIPAISSISPASAVVGSDQITMTVKGGGFVVGSVIQFAGSNKPTTYINENQLIAAIPSTDLVMVGNFNITVFSPIPGGGISSAQVFSVNSPVNNSDSKENNLSQSDLSPKII